MWGTVDELQDLRRTVSRLRWASLAVFVAGFALGYWLS